MRIVAKRTIVDFYIKHAEVKIPLEDWYNKAMIAERSCYVDIKRDFNSVDVVGNGRFVLNVKGNHSRLVVHALLVFKIIYICFPGTHKEYDKTESTNKI